MIYVLDNGASYSDHDIHFIESDLEPADDVAAMLVTYERDRWLGHPEAYMRGVAERVEWRESAPTALHDFMEPSSFFDWPGDEDEPIKVERQWRTGETEVTRLKRSLFNAIPRRLLVALVARWALGDHEPHLSALKRALAACGHDECLTNEDMARDCAAAEVSP